MIDQCFNPSCGKKLRYLREGRVVRLIRAANGAPAIEHYWLCGECYRSFDFHFSPDGGVSLGPRFREFIHLDASQFNELLSA